MLSGFKQFILRGNVVDLAVAVVVGGAFNNIVSSFVRDLLTPLIAAFKGIPDFSSMSLTINNSKVLYGDFLNNVISFLIVASVVYFLIVLPMNRFLNKSNASGKSESPVTQKCPF